MLRSLNLFNGCNSVFDCIVIGLLISWAVDPRRDSQQNDRIGVESAAAGRQDSMRTGQVSVRYFTKGRLVWLIVGRVGGTRRI